MNGSNLSQTNIHPQLLNLPHTVAPPHALPGVLTPYSIHTPYLVYKL